MEASSNALQLSGLGLAFSPRLTARPDLRRSSTFSGRSCSVYSTASIAPSQRESWCSTVAENECSSSTSTYMPPAIPNSVSCPRMAQHDKQDSFEDNIVIANIVANSNNGIFGSTSPRRNRISSSSSFRGSAGTTASAAGVVSSPTQSGLVRSSLESISSSSSSSTSTLASEASRSSSATATTVVSPTFPTVPKRPLLPPRLVSDQVYVISSRNLEPVASEEPNAVAESVSSLPASNSGSLSGSGKDGLMQAMAELELELRRTMVTLGGTPPSSTASRAKSHRKGSSRRRPHTADEVVSSSSLPRAFGSSAAGSARSHPLNNMTTLMMQGQQLQPSSLRSTTQLVAPSSGRFNRESWMSNHSSVSNISHHSGSSSSSRSGMAPENLMDQVTSPSSIRFSLSDLTVPGSFTSASSVSASSSSIKSSGYAYSSNSSNSRPISTASFDLTKRDSTLEPLEVDFDLDTELELGLVELDADTDANIPALVFDGRYSGSSSISSSCNGSNRSSSNPQTRPLSSAPSSRPESFVTAYSGHHQPTAPSVTVASSGRQSSDFNRFLQQHQQHQQHKNGNAAALAKGTTAGLYASKSASKSTPCLALPPPSEPLPPLPPIPAFSPLKFFSKHNPTPAAAAAGGSPPSRPSKSVARSISSRRPHTANSSLRMPNIEKPLPSLPSHM